MQVFATKVANVLRTFCNIDGVVKIPLQASIFTPGSRERENTVFSRVLMKSAQGKMVEKIGKS